MNNSETFNNTIIPNEFVEICQALMFRIRKIRRDQDLSQEYVAMRIGIGQNAYSRYETNDVRLPISHFLKLSIILDFNPGELLNEVYNAANPQNEQTKHSANV